MPVRRVNTIVHGAQIGSSSDEVNVMIGIVILLKIDGVQPIPGERRWCGQFGNEIVDVVTYDVGGELTSSNQITQKSYLRHHRPGERGRYR